MGMGARPARAAACFSPCVPSSGISATSAIAVVSPKSRGALQDGATAIEVGITLDQGAVGGVDSPDLRIRDPRIDLGEPARGLLGEQRHPQRFWRLRVAVRSLPPTRGLPATGLHEADARPAATSSANWSKVSLRSGRHSGSSAAPKPRVPMAACCHGVGSERASARRLDRSWPVALWPRRTAWHGPPRSRERPKQLAL